MAELELLRGHLTEPLATERGLGEYLRKLRNDERVHELVPHLERAATAVDAWLAATPDLPHAERRLLSLEGGPRRPFPAALAQAIAALVLVDQRLLARRASPFR